MLDAILILKVAIAPVLILGTSLAGIRWGHTVSGWLVGLPLTSAPVIFILSLEQGVTLASKSAEGTILGLISLSAFSLAYSWLSLRLRISWIYSLLLGWCIFFLSSLILENVSATLFASFAGVVAWLLIVAKIFPKSGNPTERATSVVAGWNIPVRMIAATSLVLIITEVAPSLGSKLSGLLTPSQYTRVS